MRYSEVRDLDRSIESLLDVRRDKSILPNGCPEIVDYSDDAYFRELRELRRVISRVRRGAADARRSMAMIAASAVMCATFITMMSGDLVGSAGEFYPVQSSVDGVTTWTDPHTGERFSTSGFGDDDAELAKRIAMDPDAEFLYLQKWEAGSAVSYGAVYRSVVDGSTVVRTPDFLKSSITDTLYNILVHHSPAMIKAIESGAPSTAGPDSLMIGRDVYVFHGWDFALDGYPPIRCWRGRPITGS